MRDSHRVERVGWQFDSTITVGVLLAMAPRSIAEEAWPPRPITSDAFSSPSSHTDAQEPATLLTA